MCINISILSVIYNAHYVIHSDFISAEARIF